MPNTAATIPAAVISRMTNGRTVVSSPVLTALDVWLCPLLFAVLSEDWLFPLLELLPFAEEVPPVPVLLFPLFPEVLFASEVFPVFPDVLVFPELSAVPIVLDAEPPLLLSVPVPAVPSVPIPVVPFVPVVPLVPPVPAPAVPVTDGDGVGVPLIVTVGVGVGVPLSP